MDLLVVILAAGQGTRMRSAKPKVLHEIAGRSILGHVMAAAERADAGKTVVVTSPGQDDVRAAVLKHGANACVSVQEEQLGTAHAVLSARAELENHTGPVIVLNGDVPLVNPATLRNALNILANGDDMVVVGFDTPEPSGYGRLIQDEAGKLVEIVEEVDADPQQKSVTLCNSGIIGFAPGKALSVLEKIGNDNAQCEYYLTDAVAVVRGIGGTAGVVAADMNDTLGINSRVQLAEVEAIYQARRRREVMEQGVTMVAPDTVTLSYDTKFAQDVVVEPNVFFGPGVVVESGATIRAFSHLEKAHVGVGATIGPYARLRPGANLGPGTRVGNFVEIKAAEIEAGAKVNHLTYVGDARVGENANIGAGTITCNYDGFAKHHTDIGAGAFVGSNSALVAPVRIGDNAYVGSGSVVTKNVSAGALAVTRAPQVEKPGWAEKFRSLMTRKKEKKTGTS
ncbi:MAG: bifunctional UDP-N-acetylglucosamine diphosphorylase/glucosamine-1-phosphate N-acetyltransferase GlmU [Hyphomicrobiaceae bacterium]